MKHYCNKLYSSSEESIRTNARLKANQSTNESMHRSMRYMVLMAQFFSLMPIKGTFSANPYDLRFRWRSFRLVYCLLVLSSFVFILAVSIYHFMWHEGKFYDMVDFMFYIGGFTTVIVHIDLAKNWPTLMTEWYKVDVAMELRYGYPKKINYRLKLTALIMLTCSGVEHILSLGYHAEYTHRVFNGSLTMSAYFKTVYPSVFDHMTPTIFTASLVQLINFFGTFFWNYNDLLIILLSSGMATRFKQLAQNLYQNRHRVDIAYWSEVRQDYDRLSHLNKKLDRTLSYIMLHSFINNLIFILVQLYFSLSVWKNNMKMVYFFYSFGFLIARTVAVSLYAAWINDESKEPIPILNSLPSYSYNSEVRRFLMQINTDTPTLTGHKLFKITRGLVLNIAGAIVTYELVLIQFNSRDFNIN